MQELIGNIVKKVLIGEGEHVLAFITDNGEYIYETGADCCSETWFADIFGTNTLVGNKVLSVEEISINVLDEYNSDDGRCRQYYDKVYGYKIATTKGYCDVIFRNSSNRYYEYYGGWIEKLYRPTNYLTTHGHNFTEITEDWSAQ